MNFKKQFTLIVIAAVLAAVFPFYWYQLVRGDVTIEYYQIADFTTTLGRSSLADNLVVNVSRIEFQAESYSSVRIVRFLLVNDESRSLESPARFLFFAGGGQPIDRTSIIDIQFKSLLTSSDVVLWDRWDSPRYGFGFELLSELPGDSRGVVTLILEGSDSRTANASVDMRKVSRRGEFLERVVPFGGTITFTPTTLLVWLSGAAATWGAAWLLVNIALGNYSTGARLVFWLLQRIKFERLVPEGYKKSKEQNGNISRAGRNTQNRG